MQEVTPDLINSDLIFGMMGNTRAQPNTRPSIDWTSSRLPLSQKKQNINK